MSDRSLTYEAQAARFFPSFDLISTLYYPKSYFDVPISTSSFGCVHPPFLGIDRLSSFHSSADASTFRFDQLRYPLSPCGHVTDKRLTERMKQSKIDYDEVCRFAAARGNPDAAYFAARAFMFSDRYQKRYFPLMKFALKDSPDRALLMEPLLICYGFYPKKDYTLAYQLFEKAADENLVIAMVWMAMMKRFGLGVQMDYVGALKLAQKALRIHPSLARLTREWWERVMHSDDPVFWDAVQRSTILGKTDL
jgi:hypothetical protein